NFNEVNNLLDTFEKVDFFVTGYNSKTINTRAAILFSGFFTNGIGFVGGYPSSQYIEHTSLYFTNKGIVILNSNKYLEMVNIRKISYDDIKASTIYEKNNALELILNEKDSNKKGENKVLVELPKEVLSKFSSNINDKLKSTNINKGYSSFFKNPAVSTISQILIGATPLILFFLL
ncbi:MAG: hypothetical protein ACRDA5_14300, partial [Clostridium sp.]